MIGLIAAVLLPLYFTAPADSLPGEGVGRARAASVHAYIFHRLDSRGQMLAIPGYADSTGKVILKPHVPGTREKVWLEPGPKGTTVTIFVMSIDANGNLSPPSNACVIGARSDPAPLLVRNAAWTILDVPIVEQPRERCGQAALAMVLRYYGADPAALREVDAVYDSVLHSSLITELAGAARRAGYPAAVATLTPDSLIELLNSGVPPILLYQDGRGSVTVGRYGVVTGWDGTHSSFILHDGSARPNVTPRDDLAKWWETAGSLALIVRQRSP